MFKAISGMLSGVLGKVPYFDLGGRYGLSVSVRIFSAGRADIVRFAFLLPDQVRITVQKRAVPERGELF